MNSVLKFLKKIILEITFGAIVKSAFLGIVVGICVTFIAYGVCDLYQLPYVVNVLANPNFEIISMLYIGGWGIAGIVAKILPW